MAITAEVASGKHRAQGRGLADCALFFDRDVLRPRRGLLFTHAEYGADRCLTTARGHQSLLVSGRWGVLEPHTLSLAALGAYATPIDKMLSLPPQSGILELMPDQAQNLVPTDHRAPSEGM